MSFQKAAFLTSLLQISFIYAASNVCKSPAYKNYLLVLSGYGPAERSCSTKYPVVPVISTITTHVPSSTTVTDTTIMETAIETLANADRRKRLPRTNRSSHSASKALSSLSKQPAPFAETVCSCIETPSTVVTMRTIGDKTTIHTTATTTTATTVTPKPSPTCANEPFSHRSQEFEVFAVTSTQAILTISDFLERRPTFTHELRAALASTPGHRLSIAAL